MIIRQSKNFRIITVPAYNGCLPITAYMIQRRQERTFFPEKWVNVIGYESRRKAVKMYEELTD